MPEINAEIESQIYGVIFGQAVGDALGFGTEFLLKSQVAQEYPSGLDVYRQITRFQPSQDKGYMLTWSPGDWTDDTDQMLCILDSLLEHHRVDLLDIARRFHHWAITDGMGMGATVNAVVHHQSFLSDPHQAAREVWEAGSRQSAANGSVMRTSVLGIWYYWDSEQVRTNATDCCLLTHADPRCVASCIAVSLAISQLLQGEKNVAQLSRDCFEMVADFHPEVLPTLKKAQQSLEALDLDEGVMTQSDRTGYTLKTLGAGFWALLNADSFESGLKTIIAEAGDADTNGAVAGALLGAHYGYEAIPQRWIDGLVYRQELQQKVKHLVEVLRSLN